MGPMLRRARCLPHRVHSAWHWVAEDRDACDQCQQTYDLHVASVHLRSPAGGISADNAVIIVWAFKTLHESQELAYYRLHRRTRTSQRKREATTDAAGH